MALRFLFRLSYNRFFSNLEHIFDTKSKTVPQCGKFEYNIRGGFPSEEKVYVCLLNIS